MWVSYTLSTGVEYIRVSKGRDGDNRSGAGEEGYAALCAGCKDSEKYGTRLSDQHVVLCKVRLLEAWIKRRKVWVWVGVLEDKN